jgi:hypothetical protein
VLYAYAVGLVEGRVADPDLDPEKIRIRWVAGSYHPDLYSENVSGSGSMC